ncbi:MAG: caspase family protein [Pseudomonadota bacterium]|nr:caspase family protein [Pseudomonadota bacterium]
MPQTYTPSNIFSNLGEDRIKVQVGNFENKLGLHNDAAVAILHTGDEIHLERPVSTYVRDALFAEIKNANFLVGRGDIVVSGDIHALGMSPIPGDNEYDRTTITFRIQSMSDDELLFEQTYSSSSSVNNLFNWPELTALSLQECIVSFLGDATERGILSPGGVSTIAGTSGPDVIRLTPDGLRMESAAKSGAAVRSDKPVANGQLFVDAEPKDARVRVLNINPRFSQGMLLEPGFYHVEVSAPGYDALRDWVELAPGENKTVRTRLTGEYSAPAPATTSVSSLAPPEIWLFSIGISDFTDETLELQYASTDARNFYKFFRSASGAMLPKTQAVLLINEAASRRSVIQSLVRMVKQANENDLVVIFLATHGLPDPDTGEINFIMHDTSLDNLVGSGLSHSDLDRIIQRSRASKVLFIVDACHSGGLGAGSLVARRGLKSSEVNNLISRLAQATDGTAVLSASSSNEMSLEGEDWGGGVFTYYKIGGLRGRADSDQDQIVALRELFDYVYE